MAANTKLRRGASSFTITIPETTKIELVPQLPDPGRRTFLFGGAVLHTDTIPYHGQDGSNDSLRILHPISPADCAAATLEEIELILSELSDIQDMSEARDMHHSTTLLEHKTRAWSISVLQAEIAARPATNLPTTLPQTQEIDNAGTLARAVRPRTKAMSYTLGIELAQVPTHGLAEPGCYADSTLHEEVAAPPSNYAIREQEADRVARDYGIDPGYIYRRHERRRAERQARDDAIIRNAQAGHVVEYRDVLNQVLRDLNMRLERNGPGVGVEGNDREDDDEGNADDDDSDGESVANDGESVGGDNGVVEEEVYERTYRRVRRNRADEAAAEMDVPDNEDVLNGYEAEAVGANYVD